MILRFTASRTLFISTTTAKGKLIPMDACHSLEAGFVERVAGIVSPGLKDALRASERDSSSTAGGGDATTEAITVPGVAYGEVTTNEETLKYTFTMHCSGLFRRIRSFFQVSDELFKGSLCGHKSVKGGFIGDGGRSGSIFFFSKDRKFAMKTLRTYELDLLRTLLPDYLEHLEQDNLYTLLPRFFGLCTIRVEGSPQLHLVIMNNVFYIPRPLALKFDLKGASAGRYVENNISNDSNRAASNRFRNGNMVVLKDHNFSSRGLVRESRGEYPYPEANHKLSVGNEMRENLMIQLERDTQWLEEHNLIDYSFLVGVIDDFAPKQQTTAGPSFTTKVDENFGNTGLEIQQNTPASLSYNSTFTSSSSNLSSKDRMTAYMSKLVVAASSGKAADDRRSSWSFAAVHENSDVASLIYDGERGNQSHPGIDPYCLYAQGRGEIYVLGIVDILQQFTCRKATENVIKQLGAALRGGHPQCMSVVPASVYSARLRHYISQNTD